VRQDLRALLSVQCPTCRGSGVTKSDETLAAEVLRAIRSKLAGDPEPTRREVVARVHPDVAAFLEGEARAELTELETALDAKITVQPADKPPHRDEFEIRVR
jgi:Ribonuclease G/E